MSPGLDGDYDWERRMKAGLHEPPPPPEYMGLEGEYDKQGLLKRVIVRLDQDPQFPDISTLFLKQEGSTIVCEGEVPSQEMLNRLTDMVAQVDGTKSVQTNSVSIADPRK